jgi:DNA-binding MarR family transcriptional regulator
MRDVRLRESIPFAIGQLFRRITRVHNRALKPLNVSGMQASILVYLWLEGARNLGELQRGLAVGSSTLTGAIDRMEKANLIRRMPVPGDRRAFRVEPLAWSPQKFEELGKMLLDTENACLADLTMVERKELLRLLHKALACVEKVDDGDVED